jgi:hypothetical protein
MSPGQKAKLNVRALPLPGDPITAAVPPEKLGDTHCQRFEGGESMNKRELELFRSLIGDPQAVSLDTR